MGPGGQSAPLEGALSGAGARVSAVGQPRRYHPRVFRSSCRPQLRPVPECRGSRAEGLGRAWSRLAGLASLWLVASGCPADPERCGVEGEPTITVEPRWSEGTDAQGVLDLPVFDAPQGGPASELNLDLAGIAYSGIDSIRLRVVDAQGTVVAQSNYSARRMGFDCVDGNTLSTRNTPLAYFDAPAAMYEGVEGQLELTISGDEARTETWPVRIRNTGEP